MKEFASAPLCGKPLSPCKDSGCPRGDLAKVEPRNAAVVRWAMAAAVDGIDVCQAKAIPLVVLVAKHSPDSCVESIGEPSSCLGKGGTREAPDAKLYYMQKTTKASKTGHRRRYVSKTCICYVYLLFTEKTDPHAFS